MNIQEIPSFVINHLDRPDRLLMAKKQFELVNLTPLFFSAFKTATKSHVEVIKKAKRDKFEQVLIFEDDVRFSSKFNEVAPLCLEWLSENKWDVFYFGGNLLDHKVKTVTQQIIKVDMMYCVHAYMVNSSAYDKIISLENSGYIIDDAIARAGLNTYAAYPLLAGQITTDRSLEYELHFNEILTKSYQGKTTINI